MFALSLTMRLCEFHTLLWTIFAKTKKVRKTVLACSKGAQLECFKPKIVVENLVTLFLLCGTLYIIFENTKCDGRMFRISFKQCSHIRQMFVILLANLCWEAEYINLVLNCYC